jgi:hypothetical protein
VLVGNTSQVALVASHRPSVEQLAERLPYRRQLAHALLRRLGREELERLVVALGDTARPELDQGCPSSPSPGRADSDMRDATSSQEGARCHRLT